MILSLSYHNIGCEGHISFLLKARLFGYTNLVLVKDESRTKFHVERQ